MRALKYRLHSRRPAQASVSPLSTLKVWQPSTSPLLIPLGKVRYFWTVPGSRRQAKIAIISTRILKTLKSVPISLLQLVGTTFLECYTTNGTSVTVLIVFIYLYGRYTTGSSTLTSAPNVCPVRRPWRCCIAEHRSIASASHPGIYISSQPASTSSSATISSVNTKATSGSDLPPTSSC